MSTRFEWFDAASAGVDFVPPHHYVDGDGPTDPDADDYAHELDTEDLSALVISGDECAVFHGSVGALRALLLHALATLPSED